MLKFTKRKSIKSFLQFGIKKIKIHKLYNQLGLNTRINSIFIKFKQKSKIASSLNKNIIGKALKNSIFEYQKFAQTIKLCTNKK